MYREILALRRIQSEPDHLVATLKAILQPEVVVSGCRSEPETISIIGLEQVIDTG